MASHLRQRGHLQVARLSSTRLNVATSVAQTIESALAIDTMISDVIMIADLFVEEPPRDPLRELSRNHSRNHLRQKAVQYGNNG